MSTDPELLEAAAKAAGIPCKGWACPGGRTDGWHGMYTGSDDDGAYVRWNPLTDDGDALRLMVKLQMCIGVVPSNIKDGYATIALAPENPIEIGETHTDDPLSATRRAIVRAAAEIGRTR